MLPVDQMSVFRRGLSRLLAVWFVIQIAGVAAPVVVAAGGAVEEVCTCPGTEHGATCPMHHRSDTTPTGSSNPCSVRNAVVPLDAALLPLSGCIGVMPVTTGFSIDMTLARVVERTRNATTRTELPDFPPPRA